MKLRVLGTDLHLINMRTRMPFRYGITTLTAVPHLFVRVELDVDGRRHVGLSADHLPPKWFTKNPASDVRDDINELLKVITTACDVARSAPAADSAFDLWHRIYQGQAAWGGGWGYPPLLTHFGTSLVERGVIDAFCRAQGVTFGRAVLENRFGIRLGVLQPELEGRGPHEFLPPEPVRSIAARHTVGLTDPLTDGEVTPEERVDDGLPQSLEACVRYYGLTHFKIKLWGDVARDADRVRRVAEVLDRTAGDYRHTLDGNENFKEAGALRQFWEKLTAEPALAGFLARLIFVEQPLHRDVAMGDAAAAELAGWRERPPMIIDESDGEIGTARRALGIGYVGTSHKNCKGVFKGLGNACLIEHRRRTDPAGRPYVLSGEDLSNTGPVALLQDLAVVASFGLGHLERNSQHYFRGLSMFDPGVQAAVLDAHDDLYHMHPQVFVTAHVEGGRMRIGSVVDAPFGLAAPFDPTRYTPLEEWSVETL